MMLKKVILIAGFVLNALSIFSQDLIISELQHGNSKTLIDFEGEYNDWLEIFNPTDKTIDLKDYKLTDQIDQKNKWSFPQLSLAANTYIVVFASKKDTLIADEIHTNFKIKNGKEGVYLFDPNNNLMDSLKAVKLKAKESYGIHLESPNKKGFLLAPTPRRKNTSIRSIADKISLVFSQPGGFYNKEFNLDLQADDSLTIAFTLDGSVPHLKNKKNVFKFKNAYAIEPEEELGSFLTSQEETFIYRKPINIHANLSQFNRLEQKTTALYKPYYKPKSKVYNGVVVKAAAFKDKQRVSEIVTNTYFINPAGRSAYNIPVVALSTNESNLFDYESGIYTPGKSADEWRINNPHKKFDWDFAGNSNFRGKSSEKQATFEFFKHSDKHASINQNIGIRIHGNTTRSFPMKSLRLTARRAYGKKKMENLFFKNSKIKKYSTLILRNGGQDFPSTIWQWNNYYQTLLRDVLMHQLIDNPTIETQESQPVIVFLNGIFWGIHNLRERYDKHYFKQKFGLKKSEIEVVENWKLAKIGDGEGFKNLTELISENDLSDKAFLDRLENHLDVDALIDYYCYQIYYNNTDWPGNNVKFWRAIKSETTGYWSDKKWRPMVTDTDFGFGLYPNPSAYQANTLLFATEEQGPSWPNPPHSTLFLRKLLNNPIFKQRFIDRMKHLLTTNLKPEAVHKQIDSLANLYAPHINEHYQRWNGNSFLFNLWQQNVSFLKQFAHFRPYYIRKHFINFFKLDESIYLEDYNSLPKMNSGIYFQSNPLYFFKRNIKVTTSPFYAYFIFPVLLFILIIATTLYIRKRC